MIGVWCTENPGRARGPNDYGQRAGSRHTDRTHPGANFESHDRGEGDGIDMDRTVAMGRIIQVAPILHEAAWATSLQCNAIGTSLQCNAVGSNATRQKKPIAAQ